MKLYLRRFLWILIIIIHLFTFSHYSDYLLYISFYSIVQWYLLIFGFFYASTTVHCTWNKTSMKTHLVWTLISVNYWLVSNGLTRRQYIIKFKAISYKFEMWNTDAFLFHYYDIFCHGPINHQELYARGFG